MKLCNRSNSDFRLLPRIAVAAAITSISAMAFAGDYQAVMERQSRAIGSAGTDLQRTRNPLKAPYAWVTNARRAGACGDSSPDAGEQCDDGNTTAGDGCSANCTIEPGADCTVAQPGVDTLNLIVNGSFEQGTAPWDIVSNLFTPRCEPFCLGGADGASDGSAWLWIGGGSFISSTDATATQTVVIPGNATTLQFDWTIAVSGSLCDSASDFLEVTIDGNPVYQTPSFCVANGTAYTVPTGIPYGSADTTIDLVAGGYNDGLAHTLEFHAVSTAVSPSDLTNVFLDNVRLNVPPIEPVPPMPSVCLVGVCGDGILSDGEACDDGNLDDNDGCDASCAVEEDYWICINDFADTAPDVLAGALTTVEDVVDGGLEQGSPNPDWTQTGTVFKPICSEGLCGEALASDGEYYAWFGGSSTPNSQSLRQSDVTISTDATDLTFEFRVGTCDSVSDVFRVLIDGNIEFEYFCTGATAGYETIAVDLTAGVYNDGGTHPIEFTGDTYANNAANSNFYVDNISIEHSVFPDRAPNTSACFQLDAICSTEFGIEKFEAGIPGGWTAFEVGSLPAPNNWTTSDDQWTATGGTDLSGCGTADLSVANWSGGNRTGGSGEAACIDSNGGAEALLPDAAAACINTPDPAIACQTRSYLCTPAIDASSMIAPALTAAVNYQTATQDFDTATDQDEVFQFLVGDTAPNALMIGDYLLAGAALDHDSRSLDASGALIVELYLDDYRDTLDYTTLYVCMHYAGINSWFAQIDNVAIRAANCAAADSDLDLVPDDIDNCTNVSNADQRDTDGDNIGNICDPDVDGLPGCLVNFTDLDIYRSNFFVFGDLDTDNNGDGFTNFLDLNVVRDFFFSSPGPSAAGCN